MGIQQRFYVDVSALHEAVTGSCIMNSVKFPDGSTVKYLIDCGLFQEHNESENINEFMPFNAEEINFCIVTHNHVDHTGRLPLLYKKGFRGKIFSSVPTSILLPNALEDSANIILKVSKIRKEKPLYSLSDAENLQTNIKSHAFGETFFPVKGNSNIKCTLFPNGHLLGAAIVLMQISYPGNDDINILYTGDYNNKNMFFDVANLPEWALHLNLTIVCESTYGEMNSNEMTPVFLNNVTKALSEKKHVIVPVFSLGRSQEILYVIKKAQDEGIINSNIPVYLDGELAINYTHIYMHYPSLGIRKNMLDFIPKNIYWVNRKIRPNVVENPDQKIILTTSGMATYGPAQYYLSQYLSRPDVLIHFSGYVAEGSLGRKLKETKTGEPVEFNGLVLKKRADIQYTSEFSAHAKADELIAFLKQFDNLKFVLVNHGEPTVKESFATKISNELDPKDVAILNRDYLFRVNAYGYVKSISTKFIIR